MKNLKLTLAFCLLILSSNAQEKPEYKSELGVNATAFIANYFNLGGVSSNNPYLIDFKYIITENVAIRSSLNFDYSNNNIEQQTARRTYFKNSIVDLRVGAEKRNQLSKKWTWFYGVDIIAGKNISTSSSDQQLRDPQTSEFVTVKSFNKAASEYIGAGPIAGLRWDLHPRITLWTEARLYFSYGESDSESGWEDLPESFKTSDQFDTVKRTNYNSNFTFSPPLDVFISFKF
jgi:hypothetical protein